MDIFPLRTPFFLKLSTSYSYISPGILFFVSFLFDFLFHSTTTCCIITVIQDIPVYISGCKVHLHPLLFVFENFPVALKMYFFALPYLTDQWIPSQIQLHHDVRYLCQHIMVLHPIAVPAVQMLYIINSVFLVIKSFVFYFPSPSPCPDHFFQIFLCQTNICDPLESVFRLFSLLINFFITVFIHICCLFFSCCLST